MYHFDKRYGSWYCLDDNNEIIYMADVLAFAFSNDTDMATLHKHGPLDRVTAWANSQRDKLLEFGGELAVQMANEIIVVSDTEWDVEVIDKFINNSGYIGKWYKEKLLALNAGSKSGQ